MVRSLLLAAALTVSAAASAQVPRPSPVAPPVGQRFPELTPISGFVEYGDPETVDVQAVLDGRYERRAVRVKGVLGPLQSQVRAQYFELRDLGNVVLIPVPDLLLDIPSLMGRRIEVVGLVRQLVQDQGTDPCDFPPRPSSYCRDPTLPPTPDLKDEKTTWPAWSITIWSVADAEPLSFRRGEAARLGDSLGAVGAGRRDVRVSGRFCGVGLCGPAPGPAPHPSAWLLQDGQDAVWVVGKEPRGKGWKLDPTYRGDTVRWLEVEGRLEPCGKARCLRAKRVALSSDPTDPAPER